MISCQSLKFQKGHNPGRPHSSDLYAFGEWYAEPNRVDFNSSEDFDTYGFLTSQLDDSLLTKIRVECATSKSSSFNVPEEIRSELIQFLNNNFNFLKIVSIDNFAIHLNSDGKGNISGNTTNGLHIDYGEDAKSIRIGINLGPIPRRVIFVPNKLNNLLSITELSYENVTSNYDMLYKKLNGIAIKVFAHSIPPGHSWVCTTAERLHDGRRQQKEGDSEFLLIRALLA